MDRKPDAASYLDRYATPLAVLLLLIFFLHVLTLIPRKSLTVDEPANIAVGYAFLKTGDVNLGEDTPPLVRVISALPLLVLDPRLPLEDSSWQDRIHWKFGNVFFDSNPPPLYFRMIFWSRVPMVLIACALGGWIYFVARQFFGSRAALVALFLFTFEPNILANAMLVKNDLAAALVYLCFFYAAWLYLLYPSLRGALHVATVLAIGMLTKFSLLVLFGLAGGVVLTAFFLHREGRSPEAAGAHPTMLRNLLLHALAGAVVVVVAVNLGYGLELFRPHLSHVPLHSGVSRVLSYLLPTTLLAGIESVFQVTGAGWPAFLAGHYSSTGWNYYYPLALAIKLPIPILIFFTAALVYSLYIVVRDRDWRWFLLLLAVVLYLVPSLGSKVNAGLRHILPIFPPMFILAGAMVARMLEQGRKQVKVVATVLLIALPVLVVRTYPDYLAYFNEVIGGPRNGWKYLSDSNLDWGEELPRLASYVKENQIENIKLAYLGGGNPEFYGIHATMLEVPYAWEPHDVPPKLSPSPGTYAISVTLLQGAVFGDRHDYFQFFRDREPAARLGGSIFIYRVE
ncbi:MAG: glycosyltransferase family 39 protein [Acidobacteriia bacterium]|nr:glycosyltransferase family 39 protein [Terriglobia bacterium]